MTVRPGPPRLDAGAAPGRLVIRVYSVPRSRRLADTRLLLEVDRGYDDAAQLAGADADLAGALLRSSDDGVCLVAYDGDTGDRLTLDGLRP